MVVLLECHWIHACHALCSDPRQNLVERGVELRGIDPTAADEDHDILTVGLRTALDLAERYAVEVEVEDVECVAQDRLVGRGDPVE